MTFDKEYYDRIYPTGIHRHDYCSDLAGHLIDRYGKVRILDIGTGCGHLVKCLRERGADAWGLEISQYAIQESCATDYVRYGTITDIPFGSRRFDVVHSQGMFGYVHEDDISTAWKECQRVGKTQEHQIDTSEQSYIAEQGYVTWRSRRWWQDQFYPRVLVACPNHECKEYAFQRWIDAVKALTYPNIDILVADNSPTDAFSVRYCHQIRIDHLPTIIHEPVNRRIGLSMEHIRQEFLGNPAYAYWFNVESDIIVPPDMLGYLMQFNVDWSNCYYPARGEPGFQWQSGFGCMLLSRRLVECSPFKDAPADTTTDGWWWHNIIKPQIMSNKLAVIEVWNSSPIRHLAEGE